MLWRSIHKALRMGGICRIQMGLPPPDHRLCLTAMHHVRRQQRDPAVMVLPVVPADEFCHQRACLLDGCETLRKLGAIFEGFELRLRVGIVV